MLGSDKQQMLQRWRIRCLLVLSTIGLLAVISAVIAYSMKPDLLNSLPAHFAQLLKEIHSIAGENPFILIACLTFLPCLPIPVSPFLLVAGAYGTVTGIIIGLVGMALNMSLTYLIANKLLRSFFEKIMNDFGYQIPRITGKTSVQVTFLMRAIPGTPFTIQNYILSLAGVPFRIYFSISMALQLIWVPGFIILGEAIFDSDFSKLLLGILLIIAAMMVIFMLRKWVQRRQAAKEAL